MTIDEAREFMKGVFTSELETETLPQVIRDGNVYYLPVVNKRTNASPTLAELARRHVKERKDHPVLKNLAFEVKG